MCCMHKYEDKRRTILIAKRLVEAIAHPPPLLSRLITWTFYMDRVWIVVLNSVSGVTENKNAHQQ